MAFPTSEDARKWLALRDTDPAAFAQLPARAQDMAQMYADMEAAREHRPAEKFGDPRRDPRSEELLALRDSDSKDDQARFRALPDRTRDELQAYEDVTRGRNG